VGITHDAEGGRPMDRVIGLRDGRLVPQILETYYGVVAGARVAA